MSDSFLVFPDLTSANARNDQLSAALGYPDATGIYQQYADPEQHPTTDETALIITRVCATDQTPYYVKDAAELLTNTERANLKTFAEMQAAGWFPEDI